MRRGDERLAGIETVDVVVRGLDSETQHACGLAKSALLDAAASALRSAGLRATVSARDSSWFYSTIVGVASSASGGRCATALSTSLIAHVDGIPGADRYAPDRWGSLLVGEMPLVSELAVVHTTPSRSCGGGGRGGPQADFGDWRENTPREPVRRRPCHHERSRPHYSSAC